MQPLVHLFKEDAIRVLISCRFLGYALYFTTLAIMSLFTHREYRFELKMLMVSRALLLCY